MHTLCSANSVCENSENKFNNVENSHYCKIHKLEKKTIKHSMEKTAQEQNHTLTADSWSFGLLASVEVDGWFASVSVFSSAASVVTAVASALASVVSAAASSLSASSFSMSSDSAPSSSPSPVPSVTTSQLNRLINRDRSYSTARRTRA